MKSLAFEGDASTTPQPSGPLGSCALRDAEQNKSRDDRRDDEHRRNPESDVVGDRRKLGADRRYADAWCMDLQAARLDSSRRYLLLDQRRRDR